MPLFPELINESDLGGTAFIAVLASAFRVNIDSASVRRFFELFVVGNAASILAYKTPSRTSKE